MAGELQFDIVCGELDSLTYIILRAWLSSPICMKALSLNSSLKMHMGDF